MTTAPGTAAAPADLGPIYQSAGAEWNVDPALLQAVAGQESGGTANPDAAVSPAGAQGRMQIMPATGQALGMTNPNDPAQSIYAGAKYLSQQLDKYGSPELALAAFNAGPGRLDDYLAGRAPLPAETQAYVPGVASRYSALASRSNGSPAQGATAPAGVPSAAPVTSTSSPATSISNPVPASPTVASSSQLPPVPRVGGDSLAAGLAQFNGFGGGGVVGANPSAVLANLQNEPQNTTGAPYFLSSGISNAGDKMGSLPVVQQQIDLLRSKGYGDIRLVGTGARSDLAPLNGPLSDLATSNGITFAGAVPSGGDGVHPANPAGYRTLAAAAQPAPVPQDGGATQRLTAALGNLRQASPAAPAAGSVPAPAASPAPVDAFSLALRAAQAATAAPSGSPPAPSAAPAPAAPAPAPNAPMDHFTTALQAAQQASSAPAGAAAPPAPVDAFTTALQAAQRASAAPSGPATQGGPQAPSASNQPHAGTGFMGTIGNYAEAAGQSALDASRALYGAIDYGNRVGPAALAPDGSLMDRVINPAAAIPNLDAERGVFDRSGVGDTWAGTAGKLTGQTAIALPALGALGPVAAAAGRGIAAGADAIAPELGQGVRFANRLIAGTASVPENPLANALLRPTSLAANGAAQGATVNLLTGDPNAGVGHNLLTGAAAGAAMGPLAAGVGRVLSGVGDAIAPFTTAGRGRIADEVLARIAQGGPLTADTVEYVPGVTPTLAQATGNAGLAGAERAVAAVRPDPFTNQAGLNQDARQTFLDGLRRTPSDLEAADVARDATAVPSILTPIANATGPANAQPAVDTIDSILASPAGQRDAVQTALGNIRSKLVTSAPIADRVTRALAPITDAIANGGAGDAGLWAARDALVTAQNGAAQPASTVARLQGTTSPDPAYQSLIDQAAARVGSANTVESDPGQLYGIRKAINDALSPLSARAGSDAQLASTELQQVKAALDNSIEGVAPGFKAGLAEYADASRPIDAMRYLQSKNFTSADGTITMAKVKGVLDDINKQQALPGPRDAKSIPPDTVTSLQGLYQDLLRQNKSRLGMQPGSNTFQNLATANALNGLGVPLTQASRFAASIPFVGNALTGAVGRVYAAQNEPVLDAVVNRLTNPTNGASVLAAARNRLTGVAPPPSWLTVPGVSLAQGSVNRLVEPGR